MSNDLSRQDEEISPTQFADEEARDSPDFGNWPEVAGLVFTILVIWMLFAFAG